MIHTLVRHLFLPLLLGLSLLLGACHSPSSSTAKPQALALKLGTMPSMERLPYMYAAHLGIYDSLGLELEFVSFFSPMERDVALQTGNLDLAITDYTSAMLQHAGGVPLCLVGKCHGSFYFVIDGISTPDTLEAIRHLRGQRVALSSHTVIDYATDRFLARAGMQTKDIDRVEVQKVPLRVGLLSTGELRGAVLPDPLASVAHRACSPSMALPFDESVTALVGTELCTNKKGAAIELLKEGYRIVAERIVQDREAWVSFVATTLQVDHELAEQMVYPDYTTSIQIEPNDLKPIALWLEEKGLLRAGYDPHTLLPRTRE